MSIDLKHPTSEPVANFNYATFADHFATNLQHRAFTTNDGLQIETFENTRISLESFLKLKEKATYVIERASNDSKNKSTNITYELFYQDLIYFVIEYNANFDAYTCDFYVGLKSLEHIFDLKNIEIIHQKVESYITWITGVDQHGGLVSKKIKVDPPEPIKPCFYPNISNIDGLLEDYLASKSPVLLLLGTMGTGKTQLIRKLICDSNQDVLLTYNDDIAKMDKLFDYFYDSKEKYMIIEDADVFISARKDGNKDMKKLLNISDGLTANKDKKIIFSTNLPNLSAIDGALLRPGRLYAAVEFQALNKEQSLAVASEIGLDTSKITRSSNTLAELFELKNHPKVYSNINVKQSTFGFAGR